MTGISVADDGRRAGGHGGLFDVEAGRLALLEVRTSDVRGRNTSSSASSVAVKL
jgi:hypothetical protein